MLSGNGWLAAVEEAKLRGARAPVEHQASARGGLGLSPLRLSPKYSAAAHDKTARGLFVGEQQRCEEVGMSVCWYGRGKLVLDAA